jgi:hypothetical protein
MAGARQVIGAQLIAHDEQDVFDLAHVVRFLVFAGTMPASLG